VWHAFKNTPSSRVQCDSISTKASADGVAGHSTSRPCVFSLYSWNTNGHENPRAGSAAAAGALAWPENVIHLGE
jgi:hypothetical protein